MFDEEICSYCTNPTTSNLFSKGTAAEGIEYIARHLDVWGLARAISELWILTLSMFCSERLPQPNGLKWGNWQQAKGDRWPSWRNSDTSLQIATSTPDVNPVKNQTAWSCTLMIDHQMSFFPFTVVTDTFSACHEKWLLLYDCVILDYLYALQQKMWKILEIAAWDYFSSCSGTGAMLFAKLAGKMDDTSCCNFEASLIRCINAQ